MCFRAREEPGIAAAECGVLQGEAWGWARRSGRALPGQWEGFGIHPECRREPLKRRRHRRAL